MISFMLPRTRACIVTDDEWARNPDSGIPKLLSECRPESCHTAPPKEPERKCRGCGEYHPARLFYTVDTEGVSHRANFCPECRQQRYRRLAELAHKKANPAEPKPKPEPKERAPRTGRRVDYTQPRPCRCCGRVLPPEAYFYSDKAAGTRKAQCKECTNKKDAERRARQAQSTNQPPHPAPLAQGQPPPATYEIP